MTFTGRVFWLFTGCILLQLSFSLRLSAQINNGSFTNVIDGIVPCDIHAFTFAPTASAHIHEGCVPGGWYVSHGTPEIVWDDADGNLNYFAHTWAGDFELNNDHGSEGIFQYCETFKEGKAYILNMKIRSNDPMDPTSSAVVDRVKVELVNGLNHSTVIDLSPPPGSSYNTPVISSSNRQVIFQSNNFSSFNWYSIGFLFIPDQDYRNIWFHPEEDNGFVNLFFDDIQLYCPLNQTYSNTSNLPWYTSRSDYIRTLPGRGGVNVLSGQDINFTAGNYIELNPGFYATDGSKFYAYIAGCDNPVCYDADYLRLAPGEPEEEQVSDEITLFPNPTHGQVTLTSGAFDGQTVVQLKDHTGRLLSEIKGSSGTTFELDLSGFSNGMYFIHILNGNEVSIRKVIKE